MVKSKTKETLLLCIWTLTVVATVGSLFYSEVIGYVPCELCWVQRIFMYPLAIIYGVAAIKRDVNIASPGFILSMIGFFVSLYHYLVQKLPTLQDSGEVCHIVPCNVQYVNYFGFITIPFLAGFAFLMICLLHIAIRKRR